MKIAAIVLGVVVVLGGGFLSWMGAFQSVPVTEEARGPYPFVYVQDPGVDRLAELSDALGERLDQAGFANRKPAVLVYPAGRGIQNQVGFVVDRSVGLEVQGADTFFRIIPEQRYAVAAFPYRNRLSHSIAAWRLPEVLSKFREARGIPETSTFVIVEGDRLLWCQPLAES